MRRLAWRLAVVGAPLVAYALVTWPWVLRMWSQAPGGDGAAFVWSFSWARQALETGSSPLYTTHSFAPVGAPLVFHTGMPLPALASVPLQWVVGAPIAFNVTAVTLVVLASVCTTALARDLGLARWPALFAGLAFAFSPAVADRYALLEHLNLGTVFWIPLLLLAVRRWARDPSAGRGALVGAAATGAAWSDLTVAIFAALAAAAYLAGLVALRRWPRRAVRGVVAGVAVAGVLAGPILAAAAAGYAGGDFDPDRGLRGAKAFSNDLAGLLVTDADNPYLGDLTGPLRARLSGRWDGANDLGVAISALAAVGLVARRRTRWAPWLALLAAGALALSLGPVLIVANREYVPLPLDGGLEGDVSALLPFTWVQRVPGLSGLRAPGRFSLLAALPLALLAGAGLQRLARGRAGALVAAVAVALLVVEAASPVVNRLDAALPPVYARVAADPDPGAIVVDVPLGYSTGYGSVGHWSDRAALAASVHRKPIASGFASRLGRAPIARVASIPLYRDLIALQGLPPATHPRRIDTAAGAASARRHGVAYVVLATWVPGADAVRTYLADACFRPVERAEGLELYRFGCGG